MKIGAVSCVDLRSVPSMHCAEKLIYTFYGHWNLLPYFTELHQWFCDWSYVRASAWISCDPSAEERTSSWLI
jgi:hypothetical protein